MCMIIPDDDRLGFFMAQLATKTHARDRLDLFHNAVIEAGGNVTLPRPGDNWGPHQVELSLLGIHDSGGTAAEALANWTARATDHMARRRQTGAAERIVLSDLRGLTTEALRAAAERVRLHSQDLAAIDAARRVDAMIAAGWVA